MALPQGAARTGDLEVQAPELAEALRLAVARANGPDWPELAWDTYYFEAFEREEWCVTVPFAALPHAAQALVPVAVAERILGLPQSEPDPSRPWEQPEPGRYYRRYWAANKRYLGLVADIAARFGEEGGHLAGELRGRLRALPAVERLPVELHLAALGLLDRDPSAAALAVLESAADEDLGARGELILHALQRLGDLPETERGALLGYAAAVARRNTVFVASNPLAAVTEALAEEELAGVSELAELVERAVELRIRDWRGWERALRAVGRAVTRLAARDGEPAVRAAADALARFRHTFPDLAPAVLLAGARGIAGPAGADLAAEAAGASRGRRGERAVATHIAAAALLLERGQLSGFDEVEAAVGRVRRRFPPRRRQMALRRLVSALAGATVRRHQALQQARRLAGGLADPECAWLGWIHLAAESEGESAAQAMDSADRAARRWLRRRPPLDVLVPLVGALAGEPGAPVLPPAARLAVSVASGELSGRAFAAELMALGPLLDGPAELNAVAHCADAQAGTWWQLPLLALLADGAAAWLSRFAPPPGPPAEQPD